MSKKLFALLSVLLVVAFVLAACQPSAPAPAEPTEPPAVSEEPADEAPAPPEAGEPEEEAPTGAEPVTITFWAAPNPPQEVFWADMAKLYMEENPNVTINVSAMPETPTSEAGILTAIAGNTAPTASENIFVGFGGELLSSQAIAPLNEFEGWQDLIAARHMDQTIAGWKFGDGNYYILPVYSNAIVWGWRLDLLQELGFDAAPRTYSEVLEVGEALKEQNPDQFVWVRPALAQDTWWERWFDFFILYYAASNGQPLITEQEITADNDAAIEVLGFLRDMADDNLILTEEIPDAFETANAISTQLGPWTFSFWAEQYPDLTLDENYILAPAPVPDDHPADAPVNTFADAKGVVIYAQATEAEQQAAFDFFAWVFAHAENDLAWLKQTNLPPARDDLATNEVFQSFFEENPQLVIYAEQLPNAVPPLAHPNFTEIQVALGDEAVVPVVLQQKTAEQAWEDWQKAVEPMLGQ